MKSAFKSFQIFLLLCGVFGADQDKVKSVMEGDSVTLNPDLTQIKKFYLIAWRFGDPVIAQTDGNDITYPGHTEIFRDRLQLDQTGSLTIKNMRIKHSGLYKLQIRHSTGTLEETFNVTVYESTSDAGKAGIKSMSLIEGNPVTLQTDVPQLYGDELIVWRFGDKGKLIAKVDIEAKSLPLYYDERFRDSLQLNDQTGSLIITNTRTTDSGLYAVKISSNKQQFYQTYFVTISAVPDPGLSPGAVAGIVVVVLLVTAAAAGVIYYYFFRISQLPSETWSVPRGDKITLNPDTEIQTSDEIQWLFGAEETPIAEIKKETREMTKHDGHDEIFTRRPKLDKTTGSLIITYIDTEHAGLYTLKIRRGRKTLKKRFQVFVYDWRRSVTEGGFVHIFPDIRIQTNDEIQWLFGNKEQQTVIAEIKTGEMTEYDGPDERFRDRLELDKDTGKLTITKFTASHNGFYTLKIKRDRETIYNRFYIHDDGRRIEVTEGESVPLEPAAKINKDDLVLWLFEDEKLPTVIAMFKRETGKISTYDHVAGGIFKDRLELDETTGSLTIRNSRTAHSGLYKLQIRSSSGVLDQTFNVTVKDKVEEKKVNKRDSVTLNPDTQIQEDDVVLWMFKDEYIAEIRGGTVETYDEAKKRFKDRLKLDKTGSLTITNISDEHTALYKLQIISSRRILYKKFNVSVKSATDEVEKKLVKEGDSVTLNPHTENTEIQEDDLVLWMFGQESDLIAQISGGTRETYDGYEKRFKGRLKLDKTTGSLTITNISDEHTGRYKLQIINSSGKILYKDFSVSIKYEVEEKSVNVGESVTLNPHTEIQKDDQILWMFRNEDIAQIKERTVLTYDGYEKSFKDRLKLDKTTGSLTISNISDEHTGLYKLQISSSSRGTLYKKFNVSVKLENKSVNEGDSVTLNPHTEIQRDDQIQWMFRNENKLIAQISRGTVETHDGADERFKGRLKLDNTTGSLTITNISDKHTGLYKLRIINSSREILCRKFMVLLQYSTEERVNESVTVVMPLLGGENLDVVNDEEGTSSL